MSNTAELMWGLDSSDIKKFDRRSDSTNSICKMTPQGSIELNAGAINSWVDRLGY
jgi:hypothetical protein